MFCFYKLGIPLANSYAEERELEEVRLKVPVREEGDGGRWLSPHAEGSKLQTENTHPVSGG